MAKRQWAVGLENMEDDQNVDMAEVEKPEEAVESHLIEVEGLDQQVSDLVDDGEELSGDTEQLEEYAEAVEKGAEDGGMDETAARVVDIGVESIAGKWGIKRTKIGAENFSGSMKAQSTKVALESIGETIKEMWAKFVTWIGEIIAKVKDFWLKYVNAGKSMKKRAEKLMGRLENGLGAKDKTEISGGWVSNLIVDSHPDVDFVIGAAAKAGADVMAAANKLGVVIDEAGKAISTSVSVSSSSGNSMHPAVAELVSNTFGKKTAKKVSGLVPNGATDVKASAIPGGAFLVSFSKDDIGQARFVATGENAGEKKLATPDEGKMKSAIKAIEQYGDALETSLKDFRKANEGLAKLKEAANAAAKKFNEAKSEEKDGARHALKAANAAVSTYTATQRAATTFLKSGGQGLIGYVTAGIGAYKKAS